MKDVLYTKLWKHTIDKHTCNTSNIFVCCENVLFYPSHATKFIKQVLKKIAHSIDSHKCYFEIDPDIVDVFRFMGNSHEYIYFRYWLKNIIEVATGLSSPPLSIKYLLDQTKCDPLSPPKIYVVWFCSSSDNLHGVPYDIGIKCTLFKEFVLTMSLEEFLQEVS